MLTDDLVPRRQGGSTTTDRLSRHAGSNDAEAACIQTNVKARYAALVVGIIDLPDSIVAGGGQRFSTATEVAC